MWKGFLHFAGTRTVPLSATNSINQHIANFAIFPDILFTYCGVYVKMYVVEIGFLTISTVILPVSAILLILGTSARDIFLLLEVFTNGTESPVRGNCFA